MVQAGPSGDPSLAVIAARGAAVPSLATEWRLPTVESICSVRGHDPWQRFATGLCRALDWVAQAYTQSNALDRTSIGTRVR